MPMADLPPKHSEDKKIQEACDTLTYIQPWRSENPYAIVILACIRDNLTDLVDILNRSSEIAKHGYFISQEMIRTCQQILLESKSGKISAIKVDNFVGNVNPKAAEPTNHLKNLKKSFINLQNQLKEIKDEDIPKEVYVIQDERQKIITKKRNIHKLRKRVGVFRRYSMIMLPFALPLTYLASKIFDIKMVHNLNKMEKMKQECDEANRISYMDADLTQLIECLDCFYSFWSRLELLLESVTGDSRMGGLQSTPASQRIRFKGLQNNWEEIAVSFNAYVEKIEELCSLTAAEESLSVESYRH